MRLPTSAELKRSCEQDNWTPTKRTDHWRYTKTIGGKTWRTKVSFGSGQIGDPSLFGHVLRDQMNVDADEFWRVVDQGGPARRPAPPPAVPPAPELPAWLVQALFKEGVPREKVAALDEATARDLLNELRSRPRS